MNQYKEVAFQYCLACIRRHQKKKCTFNMIKVLLNLFFLPTVLIRPRKDVICCMFCTSAYSGYSTFCRVQKSDQPRQMTMTGSSVEGPQSGLTYRHTVGVQSSEHGQIRRTCVNIPDSWPLLPHVWMTERVTGTGTKSERVRKKRVEGIRKLSPFLDYEERVDSDPAALSISLCFKI